MPPPRHGFKISPRSKNDKTSNSSVSSESRSDEDLKLSNKKYEGVGLVKTLLGPSFEGAVLKTLEFGKSLIQKNEANNKTQVREKKVIKEIKKDVAHEKMHNHLIVHSKEKNGDQLVKPGVKKNTEGRLTRKRIVFTAKLDNKQPNNKTVKKLSSVSKIRSLDSDLKQQAPSPEKIKRQLEALIQISKDEPPEHAGNNFHFSKTPKVLKNATALPTFFTYNTETDINYSSSFEAFSRRRCSTMNEGENSSSVQEAPAIVQVSPPPPPPPSMEYSRRKIWYKTQAKLCQAPEFLTNALGPTLDVSLAENINMIKNLLNRGLGRGEVMGRGEGGIGRGEGGMGRGEGGIGMEEEGLAGEEGETELDSQLQSESVSHEFRIKNDLKGRRKSYIPCIGSIGKQESSHARFENVDRFEANESEDQMQCKISELKTRVEELQLKEQCLVRQIEEEERERECRRKAFEEEERKLCNMKACLEGLLEEEKKKECSKKTSAISEGKDFEAHYERIKQRIASEEEKLSKVKNQYDSYKRELTEARYKKEALKRNKSLLDAWDVIASRVCHTRLPSFSRAHDLERKHFKVNDNPANIHCCFLSQINEFDGQGCPGGEVKSKSRNSSRCGSACAVQSNTEICSNLSKIPDIKCEAKKDDSMFPIQRDITCGLHPSMKSCSCADSLKAEGTAWSSDDELLKKTMCKNKNRLLARSKSEAAMGRIRNAKLVKVLWAVTRINIFQDNCRTYEVMDATTTPPPVAPAKTEGIFVVKGQTRKPCGSPFFSSRPHRKKIGRGSGHNIF